MSTNTRFPNSDGTNLDELGRIHSSSSRVEAKSHWTRKQKIAASVAGAAVALGVGAAAKNARTSNMKENAPIVLSAGEPTFTETVLNNDNPATITARIASNDGSHHPEAMRAYIAEYEDADGTLVAGTSIPIPADRFHEISQDGQN